MIDKRFTKRCLLSLFGVLLLLAVWLSAGWTAGQTKANSLAAPTDPLQESWEFAEAVGVYDFGAEVQQTLRPRAIPEMIGQTSQSVNMSLDGQALSPHEAQLTVRMEGAGLDPTPVTLAQQGNQTFILKDGQKTPTQNPFGGLAPTGSYVSYLAAAENVAACEEEILLPGAVACYTFDIDGRQFAEYTRDQYCPDNR